MLKFSGHQFESELAKFPHLLAAFFFQLGMIHFEIIRDHKELRNLIIEMAFRTKIALKLLNPNKKIETLSAFLNFNFLFIRLKTEYSSRIGYYKSHYGSWLLTYTAVQ